MKRSLALALLLASCGQEGRESAFLQSMPVPDGFSFVCTPLKVYDGDGPVWCAEGERVRLAGIAAREMDGSCRGNQPCPAASAEAARDYLARLLNAAHGQGLPIDATGHVIVKGPPLVCVSTGSAGGKRTGAWCVSPTAGDLSCRMVASGLALKWPRYWRGHRCPN